MRNRRSNLSFTAEIPGRFVLAEVDDRTRRPTFPQPQYRGPHCRSQPTTVAGQSCKRRSVAVALGLKISVSGCGVPSAEGGTTTPQPAHTETPW